MSPRIDMRVKLDDTCENRHFRTQYVIVFNKYLGNLNPFDQATANEES